MKSGPIIAVIDRMREHKILQYLALKYLTPRPFPGLV